MKQVTKAVFPVAGMGTRFLPATKASPKEMMPIVDKPLIQRVLTAIRTDPEHIVFFAVYVRRFSCRNRLGARLETVDIVELLLRGVAFDDAFMSGRNL